MRILTALILLLPGICTLFADDQTQTRDFRPELFAFETGFRNASSQDPAHLAELVKAAGFDGIELMGLNRVAAFLPELNTRGLKLHSIYLKLDLDAEQAWDARLPELLNDHSGELQYLWFHIHSKRYGRSDATGDQGCVERLRELSDLVNPHGVRIGIYMHVGLWAERFSDAVRVARKVDRKNVGAVFNLCHYLKTAGPDHLEAELRNAFPHVMLVSINGADNGNTKSMGWNRLIQPLGQGTFDVSRVLRVLREKDYSGPVGFQGFAIGQKPEDFFPRSVDAWTKLLQDVAEQGVSNVR